MQIKGYRKYLQYLDKSPEKKWYKGNITVKMCESLLHTFHHITKSFFHPTYHLSKEKQKTKQKNNNIYFTYFT